MRAVSSSPTSLDALEEASRCGPAPDVRKAALQRPFVDKAGQELPVQQDGGDHTGGDGHEHVVAPGLDPVVATRRRAQAVAAPVVDDVLAVTILGRQAAAAIEGVVGSGAAAFLHALASGGDAAVMSNGFAAVPIAALHLAAARVVALLAILRLGESAHAEGESGDGRQELGL